MANPTLDGITLYGVEGIRINKQANIIPLPVPTEDSTSTEVFDLLGVVKMIDIDGFYAAATIADTKTFMDSIEALEDGNQTTITFTRRS